MPEAQSVGLVRVGRPAQAVPVKSFPSAAGKCWISQWSDHTCASDITESGEGHFFLFSTSLYIFKVKSTYFRGKPPNIGCSYTLLFWHFFCFWTTSGRMEVGESWIQVSWMQYYSFPGWVLLIYLDFFFNCSIVNLQCWVSFKCTAKWFSCVCVCVCVCVCIFQIWMCFLVCLTKPSYFSNLSLVLRILFICFHFMVLCREHRKCV